jgi:hypothetical protein
MQVSTPNQQKRLKPRGQRFDFLLKLAASVVHTEWHLLANKNVADKAERRDPDSEPGYSSFNPTFNSDIEPSLVLL